MQKARRQFGVVTAEDAVEAGVPAATLLDRVHREQWTVLFPGVYLVPGAPDGVWARTAGAVRYTGGYAAGRSAVWLHGVGAQPPLRPHLVVPYGRRGVGYQRDGVARPCPSTRDCEVRRSRTLAPHHVVEVRGVRATTLVRAMADLAREEHPRRLMYLAIEAQRRGRFKLEDLMRIRAELSRGFPGLRVLDQVIADMAAAASDSGWEHEIRTWLIELGFPVHPEPFAFRCEDGVIVKLDIALPDFWVYIECDGRGFHSDAHAFGADRRKWTQVARQWQVIWVTYDRWRYDRPAVLADISRAMELADRTRTPARPA